MSVSRQTQPALMQTPRGALACGFRSSGRPTKWDDRQKHRSDWDDSPAAVRTLPSTLRKLQVSLATPGRGGRSWRAGLVPLACSSAMAGFPGARGAAGRTRGGVGGLWAKGQGRVLALLLLAIEIALNLDCIYRAGSSICWAPWSVVDRRLLYQTANPRL